MADLLAVKALGQQIWLDQLSRSLIESGELAQKIAQGVCGVTSNPAIFYQAFKDDPRYLTEIEALKQTDLSPKARYETMAIADVQSACDAFTEVFHGSERHVGWVSLEVSPDLAHDAAGTVAEGKRLWASIDRPNVLIKVPATDAGIAALTELVAAGVNVNLTLLFSLAQVHKAYEAYVQGLVERIGNGLPLEDVFVVASFFLSRIDANLDPTLPAALQGKVAVALAKEAFCQWQAFFEGPGFKALATRGARVLPLLWASTGTKNKAYSDVMYVEEVMGAPTINTVPAATLEAFVHHGEGRMSLIENVATAKQVLADVADLGVDLDGLGLRLQEEGLVGFDEAFAKLLALVA